MDTQLTSVRVVLRRPGQRSLIYYRAELPGLTQDEAIDALNREDESPRLKLPKGRQIGPPYMLNNEFSDDGTVVLGSGDTLSGMLVWPLDARLPEFLEKLVKAATTISEVSPTGFLATENLHLWLHGLGLDRTLEEIKDQTVIARRALLNSRHGGRLFIRWIYLKEPESIQVWFEGPDLMHYPRFLEQAYRLIEFYGMGRRFDLIREEQREAAAKTWAVISVRDNSRRLTNPIRIARAILARPYYPDDETAVIALITANHPDGRTPYELILTGEFQEASDRLGLDITI